MRKLFQTFSNSMLNGENVTKFANVLTIHIVRRKVYYILSYALLPYTYTNRATRSLNDHGTIHVLLLTNDFTAEYTHQTEFNENGKGCVVYCTHRSGRNN